MEIVTLVTPNTDQLCVHCQMEQAAGEATPTPIYGEASDRPFGLCLKHGPFEIEPFVEIPTNEETIVHNFSILMQGAHCGQTVMLRKNHEDGTKEFMLAYRQEDGSLRVVARMLPALENEILRN